MDPNAPGATGPCPLSPCPFFFNILLAFLIINIIILKLTLI
jgi:hypothetical protein